MPKPICERVFVGICGSRGWGNRSVIANVLNKIVDHHGESNVVFVLGGCNLGADMVASEIISEMEMPQITVPAKWRTGANGKGEGPIRNSIMAISIKYLIAFWDGQSTGTKDMINKAKTEKKNVYCYAADGSCRKIINNEQERRCA